ncbi:MAG: ATP-dependent RecD-like DNA helicase [Syntrophorhabdaceae bacterium]|jgi:hypothetical protein|nr:ATP-dependent RecD-like DNA helicase [Syntrophorhabdaceae bacterium]
MLVAENIETTQLDRSAETKVAGTITSIKNYEKYGSTLVLVNYKTRVYIKRNLSSLLLGSHAEFYGDWQDSKKNGQYFLAYSLELTSRPTGNVSASSLSVRIFGKKGASESVCQTIDRLEPLLVYFLDKGKKHVAKKIATAVKPKDALDVRDDPYLLYFKGLIDFETAEILAMYVYGAKKIVERDHPDRIMAAMAEILNESYEHGMSCISIEDMQQALKNKIHVSVEQESIMKAKGRVAVIDNGKIYIPKIHYMRKTTLKLISQANTNISNCKYDNEVKNLLCNRYSILTGQAGTGKTTIIKKIAALKNYKVAMTAMTGKAATLLGVDAQTLHRLLGYGYKGFSVKKLDYDIVVVDEASMLDWYTAFALFRAASAGGGCKVILCGDPRQLPPVKGGSVFSELLAVLPVIELGKVYRFVGGIKNVAVYTMKSHKSLINSLINLCLKLQKAGVDYQVITPVKNNIIGTYRLNEILQKQLNPTGKKINDVYRIGDRVIVTKNCYNKEVEVFNGQVGTVVDIENGKIIYVRLHNNDITLPFDEKEIELAYCLTVHKAQGSQYKRVIFVSPETEYAEFIDDKMMYTGTTRGIEKTYVLKI